MRTFALRATLLTTFAVCGPGASHAADPPMGALVVQSELADVGGVRDRLAAPDGADLVLLYGGEHSGSMDTCGCPHRPRGSLARVAGYQSALERHGDAPPGLLLLATGQWLDDTIDGTGRLRSDVVHGNTRMVEGLALGGWDALNVGYPDLPWLETTGSWPTTAVSANVQAVAGSLVAPPARYQIHEIAAGDGRGPIRVAVTGITGAGETFLAPEAYTISDPVTALEALVPELAPLADVVVVLALRPGAVAKEIAAIPGVDVLIEAGHFQERWPPWSDADTVWVRSDYETQRLGELRLEIDEGRIVSATDRLIDLDDRVPSDRRMDRHARRARAEIEALQQQLFAP